MRNYTQPDKIDGNWVLEGEDSVQITGPAVGFYDKTPVAQQTIAAYTPAALEAYVNGTAGLDSAANMEALYNRVVELTTKVTDLHTIIKTLGLTK